MKWISDPRSLSVCSAKAETAIRKALAMDALNVEAQHQLFVVCVLQDKLQEALALPLSSGNRGVALLGNNKIDASVAELRKVSSLSSGGVTVKLTRANQFHSRNPRPTRKRCKTIWVAHCWLLAMSRRPESALKEPLRRIPSVRLASTTWVLYVWRKKPSIKPWSILNGPLQPIPVSR